MPLLPKKYPGKLGNVVSSPLVRMGQLMDNSRTTMAVRGCRSDCSVRYQCWRWSHDELYVLLEAQDTKVNAHLAEEYRNDPRNPYRTGATIPKPEAHAEGQGR